MFSGKIGIQPELYYNSVGAKEDDPTAGTTTLKLDYISVPVLFRYNFTDMIHLLVGPQIGILASAKAVNGGNSSDFKDSVNSSDFSGVVGLGADFGPFNAGLRYTTGLSNIAKNTSGGSDVKTSAFQIVAGYKLFGK